MDSRLSIDIVGSLAHVFECTNADVTKWSLTCVEERILEDKGGLGTTFKLITEEKGRRMAFHGEVTGWEPQKYSRVFLVGDHFDIDVEYFFEKLAEQSTRVTHHSVVKPKGFMRVMFFLLGWLMKKSGCDAQQIELESLKAYCESSGQVK